MKKVVTFFIFWCACGPSARPEVVTDPNPQGSEFRVEEWLDDQLHQAVAPCHDLDDDACYRKGWGLSHPDVGEPRWKEALPYFLHGCKRRHAWSCSYLGLLYHHGVGTEQSDRTAFGLYEKGCTLGDAELSCLNGALLLLARNDVSKADETRAIGWFERSCDAGIAVACYDRGLYTVGDEAARAWYQKACELGDKQSCELLTTPVDPGTAPTPPSH